MSWISSVQMKPLTRTGGRTVSELSSQREQIALACRVLAARGLADGILGHISVRVDGDRLLIRCRGPEERGLAYTEPSDIQLVDLDGEGELDRGYRLPVELPLHTEVLRSHPEIMAVVHAHPPAVVSADLAGITIRPVVGAYDIPGMRLAEGGVPVYPRGVLVRDRRLAFEMLSSMGERPVVILRGHGLTSTGDNPAQAVLRAISVDTIARISLTVVSAGGILFDLSAEDRAELPDLGSGLNEETAWRHELARLG
jgi:ribulose-5-phosphate 4-epimerase/fuculose-1-phosphate aldolase